MRKLRGTVSSGGPGSSVGDDYGRVQAIEASEVSMTFKTGSRRVVALSDVDFGIGRGETVALVGESGSGKSTLARVLVRALNPDRGVVRFCGQDVTHASDRALSKLGFRRRVQMVLQDPFSSLDPRMTAAEILAEPLRLSHIGVRSDRASRIARLLDDVGIAVSARNRRPSEFSGGQRQRIAIARALAPSPEFLIADEPLSALDVSVQAQIILLLQDIQKARGLGLMLVTHDLSVVSHIAARVAVMYKGQVVESGDTDDVIMHSLHPYTVGLVSAVPRIGGHSSPPARGVLRDIVKSSSGAEGCAFVDRCPIARSKCATETPRLAARLGELHKASCFYPGELVSGMAAAD
jgi:oligopeptide transport system ATP-binding protein